MATEAPKEIREIPDSELMAFADNAIDALHLNEKESIPDTSNMELPPETKSQIESVNKQREPRMKDLEVAIKKLGSSDDQPIDLTDEVEEEVIEGEVIEDEPMLAPSIEKPKAEKLSEEELEKEWQKLPIEKDSRLEEIVRERILDDYKKGELRSGLGVQKIYREAVETFIEEEHQRLEQEAKDLIEEARSNENIGKRITENEAKELDSYFDAVFIRPETPIPKELLSSTAAFDVATQIQKLAKEKDKASMQRLK